MNVIVTGGAGFIGSNLCRRLLADGKKVTVFDCFSEQVHGGARVLPPDLRGHVELIIGDVRDVDAAHAAYLGKDVVVHLAAETGTGQSMYDVRRYEEVNIGGTAVLADFLTNDRRSQVRNVVVASSRAIYGEGKYLCATHGAVYPGSRSVDDMKEGRYEVRCPHCRSAECQVVATDETSPYQPGSMYGLTKQVQEQMVLLYGRALGLSASALRYQNVYGPGQSLKNPYTGILAIFSTLARQNANIRIFEDGHESRDFVHIEDVVEITARAIEVSDGSVESVNVGSGIATSVMEVAQMIVEFLRSDSDVRVTGEFRVGDIRHNYADLTRARRLFDFQPKWDIRPGLETFLRWSLGEAIESIAYERSLEELENAGLYFRP